MTQLSRSLLPALMTLALCWPTANAAEIDSVTANLLDNGGFDSDLSGWTDVAANTLSSGWIAQDVVADPASGSMRGSSTSWNAPSGSLRTQCVDVVAGEAYNLGFAARRLPENEHPSPSAFVSVRAADATCIDLGQSPIRSVEIATSANGWSVGGAGFVVPSGVGKLLVSLGISRAQSDGVGGSRETHLALDRVWFGRTKPELRPAVASDDAAPRQGQPFTLTVSQRNHSPYNSARDAWMEIRSGGRLRLVSSCEHADVIETVVAGERRLRWQNIGTLSPVAQIWCEITVRATLGSTDPVEIRVLGGSSDGNLDSEGASITLSFAAVPDARAEVALVPLPASGGTLAATLRFINEGTAAAQVRMEARHPDLPWERVQDSCSELDTELDSGGWRGYASIPAGGFIECTYGLSIPQGFSGPVTLQAFADVFSHDYDTGNALASDSTRVVRLRLNTTQDGYDRDPGDGICERTAGGNECSLRAAVMEANALGGRRTIEIPYSATAYQLNRTSGDDEVLKGDIDIRTRMILAGEAGPNGEWPIIQAAFPTESPHRIFSVNHGGSTSTIIRNLRLVGQNLSVPSLVGDGEGDGGLIHHAAGKLILRDIELRNGRAELGNGRGGAVFSAGELTLERALVADNRARRGGGLALFVDGFAIVGLSDSEFRDNSTALVIGRNGGAISAQMPGALLGMSRISVHGNSSYLGGGLHLSDVLAATLVNATISGNEAANAGGGLFVRGGGLAIGSSTIAYNAAAPGNDSAGLGGGIFHENGAEVSLYNSILAFNTAQVRTGGNPPLVLNFPHAANCHPSLASQGYNSFSAVTQDQLCAVTVATGDHLDVSPNLAPLADNGGPTSTHALTSPGNEVDLGDPDCRALSGGSTLSIDQRGFDRPSDGDSDGTARCDKGAFEVGDGARLSVSKTGAGSGTVNSSPSGIFCGATCSAVFAAGTEVTLTAAAAGGSEFVGWDGACAGAVGASCTLEVASLTEVGARFEPFSNTRELRIKLVDNEGQGSGRVQSNPPGIDCPGSCLAAFPTGTAITLSGSADAGSEFLGFYGAGCDGDVPDCALTLDTSVEVDALFDAAVSMASVQLSGSGVGRVQSDAPGIDCPGDCEQDYPITASITLQAAPAVGSVFSGWSGACSGSGACSLDMDLGPHQVTAEFALQGTQPEIFRDGFE